MQFFFLKFKGTFKRSRKGSLYSSIPFTSHKFPPDRIVIAICVSRTVTKRELANNFPHDGSNSKLRKRFGDFQEEKSSRATGWRYRIPRIWVSIGERERERESNLMVVWQRIRQRSLVVHVSSSSNIYIGYIKFHGI